MHIDFAPPSNGTYNNAGSSRQLANYLEHEDLERMEKDIYTEGFFNLTEDNIYKSVGGLSTQRHTHLAVGGFRVLAPKPYLHVSMYTAFH